MLEIGILWRLEIRPQPCCSLENFGSVLLLRFLNEVVDCLSDQLTLALLELTRESAQFSVFLFRQVDLCTNHTVFQLMYNNNVHSRLKAASKSSVLVYIGERITARQGAEKNGGVREEFKD